MKTILVAVLALSVAAFASARPTGHSSQHSTATHESKAATGTGAKAEHEHVNAYTKKDGTHVAAHDRSTKDDAKDNNWSTKGNTNPDTGKAGTK